MNETAGTERAPLLFKLVLGAAALYLLVRLIQVGAWVVDRIF
jgi:hypothetical protein